MEKHDGELDNVDISVAHHGGKLWLLRQVNLEVHQGDFLSVVGPSGSGKTTLLNTLGMFGYDWKGEFFFHGEPVHSMKPARRQALARDHIGFVFQQYHLLDGLLVITDLSRALREEERKAWQRLIRVIDHELNNSLAPIKSMAATLLTLLRRDELPGDWREDMEGGLSVIADRADALGRFMTAYSMLARLPGPCSQPVDLERLLERVAALDKRLSVGVEGLRLMARVDPDQIEQLLINLVKNAIDAAQENGGEVTVRWQMAGDDLRIEVLDTGPGVSNPDNLFVPFFITKEGGTGVGLVLCRQIAEAHGGSLSLENRADTTGCMAAVILPQ